VSSARDKILQHFLSNVGRKVTKEDLRRVAGISEWARRVRELRDEFGYNIHSYKDDPELKPGEYILMDANPRSAIRRGISKTQWYRILARDNHRCVSCGRQAGDQDPTDPDKRIILVVDHKAGLKGRESPEEAQDASRDENLATFCNVCNEGKWDLYKEYKGTVKLDVLAAIRHASKEEQLRAYDYLRRIFGKK
jgi:5-methylcytosine-specific restriction endonuclease McrA